MFRHLSLAWSTTLLIATALGQQQCYYGPGATFRGPAELVPCNPTGASACCLLGDVCLSGNACYDPETGDTYQYGCTDVSYKDSTCPFKCGFDPAKSPWTAITQCTDVDNVEDTWVCHGPESCGCEWRGPTFDMLVLQPRSCKAMGNEALVALQAPAQLAPYVSLPSTTGGSTGYFSFFTTDGTSTWVSTAIPAYTPSEITQFTSYSMATTSQFIDENASPDSATYAPATFLNGAFPSPATISNGVSSTLDVNMGQPTGGGSSSGSGTITSSPGQTPSSDSNTASSTNAQPSQTMSPGGGGLSTGAKAGIGVGVALGAIIILGLIIALIIMRRRHITELHTTGQTRPAEIEDPYIQEEGGRALSPTADVKTKLMADHDEKKVVDGADLEPKELANTERNTVYELDSGQMAELSARTSVKGSPRVGRGQVNSMGSVFTEEGIS